MSEPQVRAMFDRISGFYDVMNSVMTAGLHHRWRARAADLAALGPGDSALDVACGTGDLAIELARRVGTGGEVIGSDFSEEMLARARAKAPGLAWEWGNALELPYASGRFDAATVGFGARTSRRCRPSTGCGSTVSCRSSGALPASRRPTPTSRARSGASPARRDSPRRCSAPG